MSSDYRTAKSEKELFRAPEFRLNWFKRLLYYDFSRYRKIRKYLGGYWECWYIEICHADIWMLVDKDQAYDPHYVPGCGRGTPQCEYYPIGYFGSKLYFTEETKLQIERELKLKRLLND